MFFIILYIILLSYNNLLLKIKRVGFWNVNWFINNNEGVVWFDVEVFFVILYLMLGEWGIGIREVFCFIFWVLVRNIYRCMLLVRSGLFI